MKKIKINQAIYALMTFLILSIGSQIPMHGLGLSISPALALDSVAGGVYRLGSEDVVKITVVAGGEQQISSELTIPGNGRINVPFVGVVPAAGLSLQELEETLTTPLAKEYFVDPQVQVTIIEYHSLQYFISGAVGQPGLYELNFTPTLMDLIAKAGGMVDGRGNIAYVLRGDSTGLPENMADSQAMESAITKKEPIKVNLQKLFDQGDMTENLLLKSGDTVYIPLGKALNQRRFKIYVEGEVTSPGIFNFQPGLTAFSACIMAGGFGQYAAPNRTRIIRQTDEGQEILKINLEKVQKGDKPDVLLKPGDRIFIPESWL